MKRISDMMAIQKEKLVKKPEEKEAEIVEVKEKKGVLFTSSVASKLDIEMLEKATDSKVDIVRTYRIQENKTAQDPTLYLKKDVSERMLKDYDFAVLSVGSNDIADLDLKQPKDLLVETVINQSKDLVDIAVKIAEENKTDVFINERIPRHDEPESEMKAELTYVANSIMVSQVAVAKSSRVHLVRQSNLYRAPGEARDQLYTNGNHLTDKGLVKYSNNLINKMKRVLPKVNDVNVDKLKPLNPKESLVKKHNKDVPKPPQQNWQQKQQQKNHQQWQLQQQQQQQQQQQRQQEQQEKQHQQQQQQQQRQQQQQQQQRQQRQQQQLQPQYQQPKQTQFWQQQEFVPPMSEQPYKQWPVQPGGYQQQYSPSPPSTPMGHWGPPSSQPPARIPPQQGNPGQYYSQEQGAQPQYLYSGN